jgi:uncharacterized membrane protein YGL010W
MHRFFVEQIAMYTSYHRDPRNKATHFFGVPMIAVSLLLPMALVPFVDLGWYTLSLATAFAAAVMVFWIVADPPLGAATGILFLPALWFAGWLPGQGSAAVWIVFGLLFVVGWIIQLVGHAFEGRKPALVDNLVQIFIAPVFLVAETAFAFGLRRGLIAEIEDRWRAYLPKGDVPKDEPGGTAPAHR